MPSETRINIDTKHLIPTAAVWKSPQLISALTDAAFKGFFLFVFIWLFLVFASETPFFNKRVQQRIDQFELCMAQFELRGAYTSKEFNRAHDVCKAQATLTYLRNKSR